MRGRAAFLAAAIVMAPLGARGGDLVVWWEKGYYADEDEAVTEIVAAFEHGSGQQVDLVVYPEAELQDKTPAALEAGAPPDLAFGLEIADFISEWAFEDRLVDLSDAVGPCATLFDPNALSRVTLLNGKTGERALFALPIAGREDIWAIGLPMSVGNTDSHFQFFQFVAAYQADYVTPDGRLVLDDTGVRRKLIEAIASYTAIYRKGCTPPDSVTWAPYGNNERFLKQAVVMTPNETLSIPNELKRDRPEDYHDNVATIEWPLGPDGESFRSAVLSTRRSCSRTAAMPVPRTTSSGFW